MSTANPHDLVQASSFSSSPDTTPLAHVRALDEAPHRQTRIHRVLSPETGLPMVGAGTSRIQGWILLISKISISELYFDCRPSQSTLWADCSKS